MPITFPKYSSPMLPRVALALLLASAAPLFADGVLSVDSAQVQKKGSALYEVAEEGISIRFDDPGWDSGVRILPPQGQQFWDMSGSAVLAADIENLSPDRQLRLTIHISSGSRDDKTFVEASSGVGVNPGETRTVTLHVPHRSVYKTPKGPRGPRTLETDKINWIEFYMQWPFEKKQDGLVNARISNVRLLGQADESAKVSAEDFFPFIDVYGQYRHGQWEEKILTDEDLVRAKAQEQIELDASVRPAQWNQYGGWANGPQLEATGNFRTEKHDGKWWLVDPEGKLFFSHGVDVLMASTDATLSEGRPEWFDFKTNGEPLPFNARNLEKKYGTKDFAPEFYKNLHQRLQNWGMNTIGNWGHPDLIAMQKTPYTLQLMDYDRSLPRIAGGNLKFYDVFDPAYIDAMKNLVANAAKKNPIVEKSLTDPFCIGYFIDNELNYGNRGRQILGDMVLRSPPTQAAKQEFTKDLKEKYGQIGELNKAWGSDYSDWDDLLARTDLVPTADGYRADSNEFFRKAVDQYFRLGRDAIKSVAPHRLYLGSRFISTDAVRKALYDSSERYCDILTVNVYAHSTANIGDSDFPDMPVIIGEFHFGVYDRGMFAPGVIAAGTTQEERALAYTRFLQGALVHPKIVGTHWFQFRDQPLTGRWDGEGYAIGFVDVADTPYYEMTEAARDVGNHMYAYRSRGKLYNTMEEASVTVVPESAR